MHKNLNICFAAFTNTHICPDLRALTDCRKTFDVLEFWAGDVPSSSLRRQMSTRRWRSMWFGITMPLFRQCNIYIYCVTVFKRGYKNKVSSLHHSVNSVIYCVTLFKRGYKNHVIWIHSSATSSGCKAGRRIQELFNNVSSPGCYRDTM